MGIVGGDPAAMRMVGDQLEAATGLLHARLQDVYAQWLRFAAQPTDYAVTVGPVFGDLQGLLERARGDELFLAHVARVIAAWDLAPLQWSGFTDWTVSLGDGPGGHYAFPVHDLFRRDPALTDELLELVAASLFDWGPDPYPSDFIGPVPPSAPNHPVPDWWLAQTVCTPLTSPVLLGPVPTSGLVDDPIVTATRALVVGRVDLPVGAASAAARIARLYDSTRATTGALGIGWTGSWDEALRPLGDGGWELTTVDGARLHVAADGGRLAAGNGVAVVDGDDVVVRRGRRVATFDRDGGPPRTIAVGANDRASCVVEDGRLVALDHDRQGRTRLRWDGDRLAGLLAADGRSVTFSFDGDRLVGVDGAVHERYRWRDERLAEVLDADGVILVSASYDGDGRVRTQRTPGATIGVELTDDGATVTDHAGARVRWRHDEDGTLLQVVDPLGASWRRRPTPTGHVVVDQRGGRHGLHRSNGMELRVGPRGDRRVTERDDAGRVVREAGPAGVHSVERRDGAVSVVASDGRRWTRSVRALDDGAVVTSVVDPDGVTSTTEVHDGRRTTTDAAGRCWTEVLDVAGQVVRRSSAHGEERIERDDAGRPVRLVGASGHTTEVVRSAAGRVVERRTGGAVSRLHWAGGTLVGVTDPAGGRWDLEQDQRGQVVAATDPDGRTAARTLDTLGRTIAMIDPDGRTVTLERDAAGAVVAAVHTGGGRTTWTRDAAGDVVAMRTPAGRTAAFERDQHGRVNEVVRPDDSRVTVQRDADGRVVGLGTPAGDVEVQRTPAGRVRAVTTPAGRWYRLERTPGATILRSPAGSTVRLELDDHWGRTLTDGAGVTRRMEIDADGHVTAVEGSAGRVEVDRDAAGRPMTWRTPRGVATRTLDELGRPLLETDPLGAVTRHRHPDRRTGIVTDPVGGRWTTTIDAAGRLVRMADPAGRITQVERDAAGRPVRAVVDGEAGASHRYDADGFLVAVEHPGGSRVDIERDQLGRAVAVSTVEDRVERRHDASGRLVGTRRADGTAVQVRRDEDGVVTGLCWTSADAVTIAERRFELDADGRVVGVEDSVLGRVEVARDEAGRVVGVTTGDTTVPMARDTCGRVVAVGRTTLHRGADGRVERADTHDGEVEVERDAAGQVTAVRRADGRAWTQRYDELGRVVAWTTSDGAHTAAFTADGRLAAVDGTEVLHDVADRRLAVGPRRVGRDDLGRVCEVVDASGTARLRLDATGLPVAVDDVPLRWDPTGSTPRLAAVGDHAVVVLEGVVVVGDGTATPTIHMVHTSWLGGDPWDAPLVAVDGRAAVDGRGRLRVGGLVWTPQRWFDPTTRTALAVDPVPAGSGDPWRFAPYHLLRNDPIHHADPDGRTPVSMEQLEQLTGQTGDPWWVEELPWYQDAWNWAWDHGDELLAGAVFVGGVMLIASGVGAPAGATVLGMSATTATAVGGGIAAATVTSSLEQMIQNGSIDGTDLLVDQVIGGALAPVGGSALSGAAAGAGGEVLSGLVTTGEIDVVDVIFEGTIGSVLPADLPDLPDSEIITDIFLPAFGGVASGTGQGVFSTPVDLGYDGVSEIQPSPTSEPMPSGPLPGGAVQGPFAPLPALPAAGG